jgi:site-specific DNA-methyltransferase (adenine-specific)
MIITIARKPLIGSIVENITLHNIGGINIDQTRIGTEQRTYKGSGVSSQRYADHRAGLTDGRGRDTEYVVSGRWSANVLISEKGGEIMDKQSGILKSGAMDSIAKGGQHTTYGMMYERRVVNSASVGGASRFFKVVEEDD